MHVALFRLDNRSEYCLEGKQKKKKRHKIESLCVSREVSLKRHEGKIVKKGGGRGVARDRTRASYSKEKLKFRPHGNWTAIRCRITVLLGNT